MNILIFGSSITWGAWDNEGGWAQRIKSLADKKASEYGYKKYADVYPLGVDGDNTEKLLFRFDTEVKARLSEEKTVILIEIGINDSQFVLAEKQHRVSKEKYKENLLKLYKIAKSHDAKLIFVGLTPVDSRVDPIPWKPTSSYRMEFVKEYDLVIKEVCDEQGIPFIELLNKFTGKNHQNLLIDGLHPNSEGHKLMYLEIKNYLEENNLL